MPAVRSTFCDAEFTPDQSIAVLDRHAAHTVSPTWPAPWSPRDRAFGPDPLVRGS
ncbi:hypothetical protein [Tsukamurella soli]|uniref:hypothetical protein n=1 Tax=Tsukamurella soli TaxID=644556 RepID=UPI0031E7C0B4